MTTFMTTGPRALASALIERAAMLLVAAFLILVVLPVALSAAGS
ncbi:MAG: hypothetical protein ACYDCI_02400 [Candidatus Limnocylindrales bacterium]